MSLTSHIFKSFPPAWQHPHAIASMKDLPAHNLTLCHWKDQWIWCNLKRITTADSTYYYSPYAGEQEIVIYNVNPFALTLQPCTSNDMRALRIWMDKHAIAVAAWTRQQA